MVVYLVVLHWLYLETLTLTYSHSTKAIKLMDSMLETLLHLPSKLRIWTLFRQFQALLLYSQYLGY